VIGWGGDKTGRAKNSARPEVGFFLEPSAPVLSRSVRSISPQAVLTEFLGRYRSEALSTSTARLKTGAK
jgi:hypothetical protein